MNWGSASAFFDMGGDGFYVWGSYVVTAAFLVVEPILVVMRHKRARLDAQRARETEQES